MAFFFLDFVIAAVFELVEADGMVDEEGGEGWEDMRSSSSKSS